MATLTDREDDVVMVDNERRVLTGSERAQYLVYSLLGLLEVLLALRFVLKLTGANPFNGFVNFIYVLSGIFIRPFETVFGMSSYGSGVATGSIFEPSTLVAMAVYAVIAWIIVKIIQIASGRPAE